MYADLRSRMFIAAVCLFLGNGGAIALRAQEDADARAAEIVDVLFGTPNLAWKTLGGTQVWSDEFVFRGWRIQRNTVTNHCRLLDDRDIRQEWGTYDECLAKFEEFRRDLKLEPPRGKAVILLHGLARSRDTMEGLGKHLEKSGYAPITVSYASTRKSLDDHAETLGRILEQLDGPTELNFVCHSLGNLVVRRYVARSLEANAARPLDPRIKRMVMLGPPNQGAEFACKMKGNQLCDLVLGPCGRMFASEWDDHCKKLATPPFEFGVIAGTAGRNPLIAGENDILVKVEEAKLPGARDFVTLPLLHGDFMDDARARECIVKFLNEGYFVSSAERNPLPAVAAP